MRLLNFPPDFPFPKMDIHSQRDWKAHHTYALLEPRLIGIQRELAEQTGEADPNDPRDEEEDTAIYFEGWTEGTIDFVLVFAVTNNPYRREESDFRRAEEYSVGGRFK